MLITTTDAGSGGGSVVSASTTVQGIVELATTAETTTGTDTARAVTPAGAKAAIDAAVASIPLSALPSGSTITVVKTSGTWPARPTSRGDIVVQWKGADPSPSVVTSGTGGMRDQTGGALGDIRLVTP